MFKAFKRKGKREEVKLPENILRLFKAAVLKLPFNLDDEKLKSLIRTVEYVTLDTTERMAVKGRKSPGLYITVSGRVEAISNNAGIALRVFKKGDFFGDVSTFFDIPCPVSVRVHEGSELLFVKSQDILSVLPEIPKISLFQWFVQRKYIDTAKLFPEHALTKELAYQSLRETPMLQNWSSDCLHFLVEQTLPEILVVFPDDSYICRQGDHAHELFILVHGAARLSSNKQELITVSASNKSFCIGEEAFFNVSKRNCDVRAHTPCLVLIVNKEQLNHLFFSDIPCEKEKDLYESLSLKWKDVFHRQSKSVYSKYSGQLDLEVISIRLWQVLQQSGHQIPFAAGFFHSLFLSMNAMEVKVGMEILNSTELHDFVILLLKGCGELFTGNQPTGKSIQSVGLYMPGGGIPRGSWIKATETSLIVKIPISAVMEAQEQFLDVVLL